MQPTNSRAAAHMEPEAPSRLSKAYEWLISRWLKGLPVGQITIGFPSGGRLVFEGEAAGPHAVLNIRSFRLLRRLLISGELGLAESFLQGEWDSPHLTGLFAFGAANNDFLISNIKPPSAMKHLNRWHHGRNANTRSGSRRNIAAHYDLGNDFYGQWLDETMTYSSALFATFDEPLAIAQQAKYHRLAQALILRAGDRILEIGCGWGGFAEIAAQHYGCEVVGLTLSEEQANYARQRMAQLGLSDKVEIRVQDYRDVTDTFDKIVSIEMFEAVGEAYWPAFFDALRARLTPAGKAAMQVITVDDVAFSHYRKTPDFIQRYIFPGGMLPSLKRFRQTLSGQGLRLCEEYFFGRSYAETLRRWDQAFQDNWPEIKALGFDQRFYNMWRYYLTYCEAGFDLGQIDVGHFLIEHD